MTVHASGGRTTAPDPRAAPTAQAKKRPMGLPPSGEVSHATRRCSPEGESSRADFLFDCKRFSPDDRRMNASRGSRSAGTVGVRMDNAVGRA